MDENIKLIEIVKQKSTKNKRFYRLLSLGFGFSISFAVGNLTRFNFEVVILFGCLSFVLMCVIKRLLNTMFVIDGAWSKMIDSGYQSNKNIKKTIKTAKMGKRLAFLGTLAGSYCGVAMVVDNSERIKMYGESLDNIVITGLVFVVTFWIPQLFLLINKGISKHDAAKNPEKLDSYINSLQLECTGDIAKAKATLKNGHIPGTISTGTVAIILTVGILGSIYSFTDFKGKITNFIEEKEAVAQLEKEEAAKDEQSASNIAGAEEETPEINEAVNAIETGFYVTPDCLEAYLEYISSGKAASDYSMWQSRRYDYWQNFATEPTKFALAGMHSKMPYLLLGANTSESILFAEKEKNSNDCYIATDWEIDSYLDLSNRQFLTNDKLYIYDGTKEGTTKFVLHRTMVYTETEMEEDMVNFLKYDATYAGNINEGNNDYNVKRGIHLGELLEIKWFDIDDIDGAREYFQQYSSPEEGNEEEEVIVYNRDDYYVPGSPLVYFDYIGEGEFWVEEIAGITYYNFAKLPEGFKAYNCRPKVDNYAVSMDGASTSNYWYYVFENEEGNLVSIKVSYCMDTDLKINGKLADSEDWYYVLQFSFCPEDTAVFRYNYSNGTDCQSLTDVWNHHISQ